MAELRNQLGLGHGRTTPSPALTRHARLALNSTVTVTEFVLDTWQDRIDRGKFPPHSG
ncbi:abortive infection family protein [Streptomyces vinaceus]|uniref:abortive infection family protein n=1 Tax=Streptomyces vinaceus TaxID=1960 RepID=UPI003808DB8D